MFRTIVGRMAREIANISYTPDEATVQKTVSWFHIVESIYMQFTQIHLKSKLNGTREMFDQFSK